MNKQERYKGVLDYFQKHVPVAETELHYSNPFELLVAVILSAQCTDKRVNMVTPALLKAFPDAETMANSNSDTIFTFIKSISYPNNKAKHLVNMAKMLVTDFHNIMPSEVSELEKLPGVGRKTANVIASVIYNKPTMAVDTHVFRVSARIGLTVGAKNPLQTEAQLTKNIPEKLIPRAHHWLILHGRYTCIARKPKCEECPIKEYCNYFEKNFLKNKRTDNIKLKIKDHGKKISKKTNEKSDKKPIKKSAAKKSVKKLVVKKQSAPKKNVKKVAVKKTAAKKVAAKKPVKKPTVKKVVAKKIVTNNVTKAPTEKKFVGHTTHLRVGDKAPYFEGIDQKEIQ